MAQPNGVRAAASGPRPASTLDTESAPFLDSLVKMLPVVMKFSKITEMERQLKRHLETLKEAVVAPDSGDVPVKRVAAEIERLKKELAQIRKEHFVECERTFQSAMDARIRKAVAEETKSRFITREDLTNAHGIPTKVEFDRIKKEVEELKVTVLGLKNRRDAAPRQEESSSNQKKRKADAMQDGPPQPLPEEQMETLKEQLMKIIHEDLLKVFTVLCDRVDEQSGVLSALSRMQENTSKLLIAATGQPALQIQKDGAEWTSLQELWQGLAVQNSNAAFRPLYNDLMNRFEALGESQTKLQDRNAELEKQLAARDKELADLRKDYGDKLAALMEWKARSDKGR